jgi:methylated-DNA-[protein]-cysteine S-methyltransferase
MTTMAALDKTRWTTMSSPIGELLLMGGDDGLSSVHFIRDGEETPPRPDTTRSDDDFRAATAQLAAYLAGELRAFDLTLDLSQGTQFQRQVWYALTDVDFATTTTYGALTASLGLPPTAARAVGAALGRNPVAIVVPCHRVVGASGALTGYAGGLEIKRWLLDHERAVVDGDEATLFR